MIELFIAYRHIKERKFQSIVSIIGVSLALIVFFTSLSISNGLKKNTINSILSLNPHITVGFHNDESRYEKIISDIKEIDKENIKSVIKRVPLRGFVKYKEQVQTPYIVGIDVEKLDVKIIDEIKEDITEPYAIIGEKFAQNNNINIGNYINVITIEGKELRLKIKKIFKTGFLAYDQNLVMIPTNISQILLEKGDVVEVLTRKNSEPKIDWLELVKTSHARIKLRSQLRQRGDLEPIKNAEAIKARKSNEK